MTKVNLDPLQRELHQWRINNFPGSGLHHHFMGMTEELGELAHALLKGEQKIRGDQQLHDMEAKDAIGDLMIYTMQLCSDKGWSFEEILADTAAHVLKRDWKADPVQGVSPGSAIDLLREHDGDPDWKGA